MRYATPSDGWAFGARLAATHDGGATWRAVRSVTHIDELLTASNRVYVRSGGTVLQSPVASDEWTAMPDVGVQQILILSGRQYTRSGRTLRAGTTSNELPCPGRAAAADRRLVVACTTGLQLSTDAGKTFKAGGEVPGRRVAVLATAAGAIYAGNDRGFFVSANEGRGWTEISATAPRQVDVSDQLAVAVLVNGRGLMSRDAGQHWMPIPFGS